MIAINWQKSYAIGIPKIDEHHQHLFVLLNEFFKNILSKSSYADLESLFKELVDYVAYHFTEEERLMKNNSFPGLEMHREEHGKFAKRVLALTNDYHAKKDFIFLETATFIFNWIQSHILKSDAEFGRFIAATPKGLL